MKDDGGQGSRSRVDSTAPARRGATISLLAALLPALLLVAGCSAPAGGATGAAASSASAESPAADQGTKPPENVNWIVYINDEQTQSKGGMTYGIAMNLTAKNTSGGAAGTYTGSASAHTTTQGAVGRGHLTASAVAKSTALTFALQPAATDDASAKASEAASSSGGALAPLTEPEGDFSGTGSITMAAAGTASVGPAAGGFGNTLSQSFKITVNGSDAVMNITINGMKWTFKGVMRSEPR